jgi:hypothetical protein
MSDDYLQLAKEFIQEKDFTSAKKILKKIPNNPIAQKWLVRIEQLERRAEPPHTAPQPVMLPLRLETILRSYLTRGETVIWYEQPEPNIYSRYLNPAWMIATFEIVGIGLLAFWLYFQLFLNHGGVTSLFLIQILTPIIFIFAPFIRIPVAQRRAATIHYVVTDRQGFIVEKLNVKTLSPRDLRKLEVVEEKAGLKSLIFHRPSAWWNFIMIRLPIGFLGIADADKVQALISHYWTSD